MTSILNFPSDLERLETSRRFIRKLQVITEGKMTTADALLCVYQTWAEWSTAASEWRCLRAANVDISDIDWVKEELTHTIESFCAGFKGNPGDLIRAAVESNFMTVEERGNLKGLVLTGFWALNQHLDPNFKTQHQKGGLARAERRRLVALASQGKQTRVLQETQGNLVFGENAPTTEEQDQAYTLIIRIDRACGKAVRLTRDYTPSLMQRALEIIRAFKDADFLAVESYLNENRENPAVVKVPDQVIERFPDILEAARNTAEEP